MAQLELEINNNRPIEAALRWWWGGGHVVIVRGWSDNRTVYVNDPWLGQGAVKYLFLLTAYGMGTWRSTFYDFRS